MRRGRESAKLARVTCQQLEKDRTPISDARILQNRFGSNVFFAKTGGLSDRRIAGPIGELPGTWRSQFQGVDQLGVTHAAQSVCTHRLPLCVYCDCKGTGCDNRALQRFG